MNDKLICRVTATIMAQGLSAVAQTATNSVGTNAPAQLPDVLVTGQQEGYKSDSIGSPKFAEPLRNTAQSISVVPREVMDDQHTTTLRDALRNVAGISIAAGEGGSQGDNLTLRGFTARSDFFLDGMRDYGSYYRDPFNLDSVDVLKGPESVMFGRGSTGGVVNQESKTPYLTPFIEANLSVGTDFTRRATADVNEPLPGMGQGAAFRVNLMGTEAEVSGRDVVKNRRFGFAPSLTLGLGTPTRFTLSYYHQSSDDIPDYGLPWLFDHPAPVSRNLYYGFDSDYLKTDVDIVTAKVEHDFNEDVSLRNQTRYAYYTRDFRITEPRVVTNAPPYVTVTRNELAGKSKETFLQDQLDLTAKFKTGPVDHTLITGIEGGQETSDPIRYAYAGVPATTLYNPNENQPFSGTATVSSDVKTTANSFGVYLVEGAKLGEHLEISGGFRWDYFQAHYVNSTLASNNVFSRVDEMPSWRAAIVYKPTDHGSIYFSYGTSFNPSAESLSLSASTANVAPEESRTFEIGTKWDLLEEKLSLRAALFRTEKTNVRETDPNNATLMVLAGDQQVQGLELEATGQITRRWKVFASYAYMDSETVKSVNPTLVGLPLGNVPKHTLSLWNTLELPWKLETGTGLRYVSSRLASSTAPYTPGGNGLKELPDYWTIDAMLKYHVNKHVDLQVNVYNLTDNFYFDQIHPGHIVPSAGISGVFSANFRF